MESLSALSNQLQGQFQLPPLCVVCLALDAEDNHLLTAFVIEQVKTNSLTSTIMESCNFYSEIQSRNASRPCKQRKRSERSERAPETLNTKDVEQHILYCVATRANAVGKLVCNTVIMRCVHTADKHHEVVAAARLLLQAQSQEKAGG